PAKLASKRGPSVFFVFPGLVLYDPVASTRAAWLVPSTFRVRAPRSITAPFCTLLTEILATPNLWGISIYRQAPTFFILPLSVLTWICPQSQLSTLTLIIFSAKPRTVSGLTLKDCARDCIEKSSREHSPLKNI